MKGSDRGDGEICDGQSWARSPALVSHGRRGPSTWVHRQGAGPQPAPGHAVPASEYPSPLSGLMSTAPVPTQHPQGLPTATAATRQATPGAQHTRLGLAMAASRDKPGRGRQPMVLKGRVRAPPPTGSLSNAYHSQEPNSSGAPVWAAGTPGLPAGTRIRGADVPGSGTECRPPWSEPLCYGAGAAAPRALPGAAWPPRTPGSASGPTVRWSLAGRLAGSGLLSCRKASHSEGRPGPGAGPSRRSEVGTERPEGKRRHSSLSRPFQGAGRGAGSAGRESALPGLQSHPDSALDWLRRPP